MLDDSQLLKQRDTQGALDIIADSYKQATFLAPIQNDDHDPVTITRLVMTGMGGSALVAMMVKTWLKSELTVPFEIVRGYDLPQSVDTATLVIASSYSGNTEETLSALDQARSAGAVTAVITAGGALLERARTDHAVHVVLPEHVQPRMAMIDNLRAFVHILVHFGLVQSSRFDEIADLSEWLRSEMAAWTSDSPTDSNLAKQLASQAVGKVGMFVGGALTSPLAYKWKICWNENGKNVAFWNEYPELSHNEFIGWTSHPVEKPFAVFDLVSTLEHPQILKRFEVSDRLLSGKKPKSIVIELKGDTLIQQLLWGSVLADFASCYLAILNGVDPTPVALVDTLKKELS